MARASGTGGEARLAGGLYIFVMDVLRDPVARWLFLGFLVFLLFLIALAVGLALIVINYMTPPVPDGYCTWLLASVARRLLDEN